MIVPWFMTTGWLIRALIPACVVDILNEFFLKGALADVVSREERAKKGN